LDKFLTGCLLCKRLKLWERGRGRGGERRGGEEKRRGRGEEG
jgi:hypothetical protein